MMEPSLPIWMMSTMRASEFEQGEKVDRTAIILKRLNI